MQQCSGSDPLDERTTAEVDDFGEPTSSGLRGSGDVQLGRAGGGGHFRAADVAAAAVEGRATSVGVRVAVSFGVAARASSTVVQRPLGQSQRDRSSLVTYASTAHRPGCREDAHSAGRRWGDGETEGC